MTSLVVPLDSQHASIHDAGGKAAGLAAFARAGFPVPPAFIVTTRAYGDFVAAANLAEPIRRATQAPGSDSRSLDAAAAELRAMFSAAPIDGALAGEIRAAYARLAEVVGAAPTGPDQGPAVAVRSSATAEDLPDASFAGQQDTFLNVRGEADLLDAVRRCWASLWTTRAIVYRNRLGIDPDRVAQAVLVQWLVPAECSGVLFTINPLSGKDEVVINAAWGLGESVAAGAVDPDSFTAEKATGRLLRQELKTKLVMTIPDGRSVKSVPVEPERKNLAVLDAGQVARLTDMAAAIERHVGAPQDVEWAIAGDRVFLLQSRAITAVGQGTVPGDDAWPALGEQPPHPFDVWTLANVGELWPDPVSPMVASAIPEVIGGAVRYSFRGVNAAYLESIQWAKRLYGRIYYNEGALRHVVSHELGLPASLLDRSRGNTTRASDKGRIRPIKLLLHAPVLYRLATRQFRTGHAVEDFRVKSDREVAAFLARKTFTEDDRAVWDEGLMWLEHTKLGMNLQNEMTGLALTALGTLESLLKRWFRRQDLAHDLVTGMDEIRSAQMGAGLSRIAHRLKDAGLERVVTESSPDAALAQLRGDPRAASVIAALDDFLAEHGHRCVNEAEWLNPRWHDAPEQVLPLVAAYLRDDAPGALDDNAQKQRARRENAVKWVEERLDVFRRALFRLVLYRAQHGLRLRDNGKSAAIKVSYPARRLTALLGERWAERGWLAKPDDVFFLTIPDMRRVIDAGGPVAAGLDLRTLVTTRRRAFKHWFRVKAPSVLDPSGRPLDEPRTEPTRVKQLHGIAASGGRIEGVARVVHSPEAAFAIGSSEILVTRATDVGWTAAFPLIGGLITEIGGQLSHAAIVAREYGLPALVGVAGATSIIRDGQTVVLDAEAGTVFLLGDNEARESGG